MLRKHKIYILYTGVFCKVGVTSRNIEDRIKEIQTSCPLPIYAYRVFGNLSKGNAYFIENKLKEHLQHHLIFGEWYKQFDNIRHSIQYLIEKHTSEDCESKVFKTGNKRFYDLSIRVLNEIKEHRNKKDLKSLSFLYNNLLNSKNYNETRFFIYSKDEVIKQTEIAIRNIIAYFSKNQITIDTDIEKSLIKNKNKILLQKEELHETKYCSEKRKKEKMNKVINNYPFLFESKE